MSLYYANKVQEVLLNKLQEQNLLTAPEIKIIEMCRYAYINKSDISYSHRLGTAYEVILGTRRQQGSKKQPSEEYKTLITTIAKQIVPNATQKQCQNSQFILNHLGIKPEDFASR